MKLPFSVQNPNYLKLSHICSSENKETSNVTLDVSFKYKVSILKN